MEGTVITENIQLLSQATQFSGKRQQFGNKSTYHYDEVWGVSDKTFSGTFFKMLGSSTLVIEQSRRADISAIMLSNTKGSSTPAISPVIVDSLPLHITQL